MSSFTSSSEAADARTAAVATTARRFRLDWAVLLTVALFGGLEVVSRTVLVEASKDFRRFRTYPAAAQALEAEEGARVALVGNSATDRGVDPDALARGLGAALARPAHAFKFVADASRINTWQFILKRNFWDPAHRADLFVVTFYEDDLEDGNRVEIGRLAQFFTTRADWPSVFDIDLPELGDQLEFALSSVSTAYAVRARVKERVLGVLPGQRDFATHVNAVNMAHTLKEARARAAAAPARRSYRALDRLLADARQNGTRLLFVAYPTPLTEGASPYVVSPEVLRRIREAGMEYLDMRGQAPLLPAHYEDDVHLTPAGAAIYTEALAGKLAPFLAGHQARAGKTSGD